MVSKRDNFRIIKGQYKAMGKSNVRLTQSTLFLTKNIDATVANYEFDVLENQTQSILPDELRLNQNDEFTVTDLGVYLYGEWTNGQAKKGFQLMTYAPIELGSDGLLVKNLYAGQLKIAVNNIVYTEKWDLRKHEITPNTQFANQEAIIAGVANAGFSATAPSLNYKYDAMETLAPLIVLSGAKKNDLTIRLPQAIAPASLIFVNAAGESITINITRIAIRMYGLLGQNAAKFQN